MARVDRLKSEVMVRIERVAKRERSSLLIRVNGERAHRCCSARESQSMPLQEGWVCSLPV